MTRSDVRVLIGHTPNSGREVWTNPYRIESVVAVRIVPNRVLMSVDDANKVFNPWQRFWSEVLWQIFHYDMKAWIHPAAFIGTQITMESGDSGIIREPVAQVLDTMQTAFQINWEKGGEDAAERPPAPQAALQTQTDTQD